MNQKFNPNTISRLVFDLNSLHSISSEEGWSNFQAMVKIFDDRSYSIVLISQTVRVQDWQSHENVQVLHGSSLEMLEKNTNLDEPQVFGITDDSDIQSELHRLSSRGISKDAEHAQTKLATPERASCRPDL